MIIVAGKLYVDPDQRSAYLSDCRTVIEQARKADGCLDFHLSADPIEHDRINVSEQWTSTAAVEAFRGAGPEPGQLAAIRDAHVEEHEIATSRQL